MKISIYRKFWSVVVVLSAVGILSFAAVASATLPDTPFLVSPYYGQNVGGTSVIFSWAAANYAYDYYLEIAVDPWFNNVVYGDWTGGNTSVQLIGFPDVGTVYYWHVIAWNYEGFGYWSSTFYFVNGKRSRL